MTIQNTPIVEQKAQDVLAALKRDVFFTMNCHKIGTIQKVDGSRRTLEVQVVFNRVAADGTERPFPLLIDVPFVTIQGGGVALQVPVSAGDECLLLFSDRNIDAWFKEGGQAAPLDGRAHDASDALAIVGLNNLTSALPANPTSEGRLISGTAKVGVLKDGSKAFLVQGAAKVEADGGLVRIKNGATDLKTAIDGLIDVLEALTVQGPSVYPLTSAAIAALDAQKAVFAGLLTT